MSESIVTARDIEIVTAEIQVIKTEARKTLAMHSLAIGQRLCEAKSMLEHGDWMKWLSEKVEYSQSTANNLMKLYNEYGSNQQSLFDNFANSQTFQNLTTSQALALLAVPAEERQSFAEENNVADLSTRELQKLIQERDAADHDRREAETARAEAEAHAQQLQTQLQDAGAAICDLTAKAGSAAKELKEKEDAARKDAEAARQEMKLLEEKLQKARTEMHQAKQDLEAARKNPKVPEDQMAALRKEAEAAAKSKYAAQLEKEIKKAQEAEQRAAEDLQKAEAEAADYKAKLVAVQSQSKMQDPDVFAFNELFKNVQTEFKRMMDLREKISQHDHTTAENLQKATVTLLHIFLDRAGGENSQ